MPSTCSVTFVVNFSLGADAAITLGAVTTMRRPGFQTIWYWTVSFTYVTGEPAATGFGLSSPDMLSGTFTPSRPATDGSSTQVRNGILEGTVVHTTVDDVTYRGTITIFQE